MPYSNIRLGYINSNILISIFIKQNFMEWNLTKGIPVMGKHFVVYSLESSWYQLIQ